ncbi:hypothetical protein AA313_de0200916 [Arthrobotrys entomopaga]|nr:hypothetical protein AA313_de0200916 [Arthrobotrys entomopaga]
MSSKELNSRHKLKIYNNRHFIPVFPFPLLSKSKLPKKTSSETRMPKLPVYVSRNNSPKRFHQFDWQPRPTKELGTGEGRGIHSPNNLGETPISYFLEPRTLGERALEACKVTSIMRYHIHTHT